MPAKVKKVGKLYRVVESNTDKLVRRNSKSKPVDGGGHKSLRKALSQIRHINRNI